VADPRLPTIEPNDLRDARIERIKVVAVAFGVVGGVTGLNYRFNAPGGTLPQKVIQVGLTGIKVEPTAAGRASVKVPILAVAAGLLPSPVGYVPAEFYGQHPELVKNTLGFRAGQKPPILSVGPARLKEHDAREAVKGIIERVGAVPIRDTVGRVTAYEIPEGPLNITREEFNYLASLPKGFDGRSVLIVRELEGQAPRFKDTPSSYLAASSAPAADGGFKPLDVEGASQQAIASGESAEGIRHELVTERADP